MKDFLKKIIHLWPWPLTRNEKYDRETKAVIRRVCQPDASCIDVGCFKGDILRIMINAAPNGTHFAFEPIPHQYQYLAKEFQHRATIYPYALGSDNGTTTFQFVKSNPTYSGLRNRQYIREEIIETIDVQVRKLEDVMDPHHQIHLIKIDVEGGEYDVLKGAETILQTWHPVLIFEHGRGGSDLYGINPEVLFQYLTSLGYKLGLMEEFLSKKTITGFTQTEFESQFWEQKNCYFLALTD
jgi:FkbM family methyltransferase